MDTPEKPGQSPQLSLRNSRLREILIDYLMVLADVDLHDRVKAGEDSIDLFLLHGAEEFLFDERWPFIDDARYGIGICLHDEREAAAVQRVLTALDDLLYEELGLEAPDEVFLHSPAWPNVVPAAAAALKVLREPRPASAVRPPHGPISN